MRDRLYALYVQSKTPLAAVLFVAFAVARILGNNKILIASVVAMVGLALQILLTLDHNLSKVDSNSGWNESFQEALPEMRRQIDDRLRRQMRVRIRWIGVTHEAGWPFSQNLLLSLLHGKFGGANVSIQLAMLDPDGAIRARPDGPNADQLQSTKDKIEKFISAHGSELGSRDSVVELYFYDHRPTWHALIIDDDVVFFSTCMPQNLSFASPQGGAEMLVLAGSGQEVERVRNSIAWFEAIKSEAIATGKFVSSV